MKRTPALARLERRLAVDPCAILATAEVRLLDREVRRALLASFPGVEVDALLSEDLTRWHTLGARCRHARGARALRDVSVATGIPQYRLRAIESGQRQELRVDLARRYFHFLGIEPWIAQWCRANRDLARRVGLLDWPSQPGHRARRARSAGAR